LPDRRRLLPFLIFSLLLRASALGAEPKAATPPSGLSYKIESILGASEARRGHWGIEVVRLRDGKVLYSRQAEQLFLPASNMKLFTTAAAIERLGPDFRFRTTVEATAPPDAAGRVVDLFLVGRGDPFMGNRVLPDEPRPENAPPAEAAFQVFADQLVSKGVREVTGNLIADDTYFVFEPYSRGWEEDDLVYGYAAPVTALAFNDNALLIRFAPGPEVGAPAQIDIQPFPDYFSLNNRLETAPEKTPNRIRLGREAGSRRLEVWGQIALGADSDEDSVSVDDPSRWAAELLRKALEARGIRVGGSVEVRRISPAEASARDLAAPTSSRVVLAERLSAPLSEDVKIINKFSHNLHVEMLLRTLGKELNGQGSSKAGIEVLEKFVQGVGIEKNEATFSDGSGLSRHSLIAPRATIKLLRFMAKSPRFPVFLDSLPIAGEDGTLDDRFERTSARGKVRAKTGTLEHVNALSGYMDLPSGERLAFSIMGNEHPLRAYQGKRIVDRIAVAIFEHFGGGRKAKKP
jgi:D-alanyl-D-alanine carboxypeptidase/D-alanyl-D-alanine-endopeptidase (penicillin-binding protein 4)